MTFLDEIHARSTIDAGRIEHVTAPARPRRWHRRTMIATAILVAAGFLSACAGNGGATTRPPDPPTEDVSQGLGSKDATADVALVGYTPPVIDPEIGMIQLGKGQLDVINNSSKTSDYYIELNVLDANGTIIGWTNAAVPKLQPDAKASISFETIEDGAASVTITEVQRTASV